MTNKAQKILPKVTQLEKANPDLGPKWCCSDLVIIHTVRTFLFTVMTFIDMNKVMDQKDFEHRYAITQSLSLWVSAHIIQSNTRHWHSKDCHSKKYQ